MKRELAKEGKGAVALIEESFWLVWHAPRSALAVYFLCTLPFALGLLFFFSDMSRSAFAPDRLLFSSLGLTLLFLFMKCGHSLYTARLQSFLSANPLQGNWVALAAQQGLLQATGLILLPLSLGLLLPFGWAYAFYSNATVMGFGEKQSLSHLIGRAWKQALLWPGQNHYAILALKLFFFFVALNLLILFLAGPWLLKTMLGLETVFSRSFMAMFNTTFFAAILITAYICVDPVAKALYTLRCFHGESLETGSDLRAELKRRSQEASSPGSLGTLQSPALLLLLATLTLWGGTHRLQGQPQGSPAPTSNPVPARFSAAELDASIDQTITQRKYAWRMPRERLADPDADKDEFSFFKMIANGLESAFKEVGTWIKDFLGWLRFTPPGNMPAAGSGQTLAVIMRLLLILLVVALALLLGLIIYKMIQSRRQEDPVLESAATSQPAPDLADENVAADQLPENQWIQLARELLAQGQLRLAMRAFYLASLAHLAHRNLVTIAKFKSNRDYQLELARRAHALPVLSGIFADNVSAFDRVWYGLHEVTHDLVDHFAHQVEEIRSHS